MENAGIDGCGYFTSVAFHAGPVPGYCLTVSGENAAARNCIGGKGCFDICAPSPIFSSFLSFFPSLLSLSSFEFVIAKRLNGTSVVIASFSGRFFWFILPRVSSFHRIRIRIAGIEKKEIRFSIQVSAFRFSRPR